MASAFKKITLDTPKEEVLKILKEDAGVIIKGMLTPDQVARFNADVQPQMDKIPAGSSKTNEGAQDFHGANTKRLTNLVTHSKTFREEIIDHDKVHQLAHAILSPWCDTYWMGTAQVIEIGPGNKAQPLHRDFENYMAFKEMGVKAPDVICNFLIALSPCTEENGATRIIPGSQNWPDYDDRGTPEMTVAAELEPGDALFFTGKIAHGGGANVTTDQYRRAVAFTFNLGWLVPEEAYPFVVDMELVRTLSPRVQQILGFRSFTADLYGLPGLWQVNYEEIADYIGLNPPR